jgi:membrane-associated phospholipid phosphatase
MKKTRVIFSLFVLFSVFSNIAKASFLVDRLNDAASPVTTPASAYLIGGGSLTALLFLLRHSVDYPLQTRTAANPPLSHSLERLGYHGGELYPNLGYVGIMLVGAAFGAERSLTRVDMMVSASAYSGAVEVLLKSVVHETRPNNYDQKAFPSGHATVAYAFASVVASEHPWYIGVPAYALATLTGYSRMNDNAHYLHDVIAGATIGISYGLGMHYRRPENADQAVSGSANSAWNFQLLPMETGAGIFASTKF